MKRCAKCGETKELSDFYRQAKSRDGKGSYCKACAAAAQEAWRERNPDKPAAYQRRYQPEPSKRIAAARRSEERHPEHVRARNIVRDMIASGELQSAKLERCFDCGGPAAQYDHAYGYALDMAFVVEPVCHRCHGRRSRERGEHRRTPKAGGRELDGRTWDQFPGGMG